MVVSRSMRGGAIAVRKAFPTGASSAKSAPQDLVLVVTSGVMLLTVIIGQMIRWRNRRTSR
ncbi:protein of unknown function [Methylocella tundrae]|uniref:Uncharacterized protein n=1 Tax=Methylocella tundrae TaxID=227605 RepID=A0A4U8YZD4_METTU|nr:protein of unknown function [Methylocella tundrae]